MWSKSHRPHFHVLVFGLPLFETQYPSYQDFLIHGLISYSWSPAMRNPDGRYVSFRQFLDKYNTPYNSYLNGHVDIRPVFSADVVRYIMKYNFKDSFDNSDNFRSISINLGYSWLKQFATAIAEDGVVKYTSHIDNCYRECKLSGYYIRKLFPTCSKLIPFELRNSYYDFLRSYNYITSRFDLTAEQRRGLLCNKIYLEDKFPYLVVDVQSSPYYGTLIDSSTPTFEVALRSMLESFNNCLSYELDYRDIMRQTLLRDKFLSHLDFRSPTVGEIHDKARRYRKKLCELRSKTILN